MSLRWKIVLLLCGVFVLLLGMSRLIDDNYIFPAFVHLEQQAAAIDMSRCVRVLSREAEYLDRTCHDWAESDATRGFVTDRNEASRFENLSDEALRDCQLVLLALADAAGTLIGVHSVGPAADRWTTAGPAPDWDALRGMLAPEAGSTVISGVVACQSEDLLVAARPVMGPDCKQLGRVLMARPIDEPLAQRLMDQTRVNLSIRRCGELWGFASATHGRSTAPGELSIDESDRHTLRVHYCYPDVNGRPALLLTTTTPRSITAAGATARDFSVSFSVSLLVIIGTLAWMLLEVTVVRPLARMRDHVTQVGERDALELTMETQRDDEIGELARAFNRMTESLADFRRRAMDAAHRSGMNDSATSILHNVGNLLNSVCVSTDLIQSRAQHTHQGSLRKVAQLVSSNESRLDEFLASDERGRLLPAYLQRLADALDQQQESLVGEINSLQSAVQHIRDVIATHQSATRSARLSTSERLDLLVRDALEVHESRLRAAGIRVNVAIAPLPPVRLNRPKLLQVLENLIRNAIEAIEQREDTCREIAISGAREGESGVVIRVTDTGVGFAPEVGERVFASGFTTKPRGNGLGLHFCANAVTELGGRISASSPGAGRGATFTITLPICEEIEA